MDNEQFILRKTINNIQKAGKRKKALYIFKYIIFFNKQKKYRPIDFWLNFIQEISPTLTPIRRSFGNKVLDLPNYTSVKQQYSLGINWFFRFIKKDRGSVFINFNKHLLAFNEKKGPFYDKRKRMYDSMISGRPFLDMLKHIQKKKF